MYNSVSDNVVLKFEWDPAKAQSNLAKHGVSFELATRVWDDPLHVVLADGFEGGEQRWHAVGLVGEIVLLVVVHAYPMRMTKNEFGLLAPERRPARKGHDMSKKPLSAEERDQLAKLAALPEDQIDTTDIPEAPEASWTDVRRADLYRPVKKPVTIRLDADVLTWFKEHSASSGYQTEINKVLRRHVSEAEKKRA